ncbi:hypothetical protein PAEH1_05615 [Paenalcaligenes hominis]|uniref:HTH lysR-type domain-containing protein n=1 Tax=Paenalcaligenes hominis TaxID=643674 RepID=A0A1U9JZG0_9BURK|nr:LysR family transcriptional regulator [Paenalcaligenes hominis]AQS51180.1 hypothetical protein PAEH1_05615 [Paenalcaligenes hominis]
MLNVMALRYFVETVRLGSFTAAAQSLGVGQSTVSKMVRTLEDQVGELLIVRNSKPLLLSDVGQVLFKKGGQLLQDLGHLQQEVHHIQALTKGHLRIGLPPMINLLFTSALKEFRERYPTIHLQIIEQPGPAIEQLVASGQLDLGFSIAPIDPDLPLQTNRVISYPIYALGRAEQLPRSQAPIRLQQLVNKPLLFLNDEFGLTRLLRRHLLQEPVQPRIYAQSSQGDWLISMAQAGLGVAVLPQPFCQRLPDELSYRVIEQTTPLQWEVVVLWNGRYLSQAAKAWLECCALVQPEQDWHELLQQISQIGL